MINIISAQTFKAIPWKNGKGVTTELAINPTGTLASFQWRLSIATVSENGIFSDFSGYIRNLVLIDGDSLSLTHNDNKTDTLTNLLDFATFDGGNKTVGKLPNGAIKDFNIITSQSACDTKVETYRQPTNQTINFQGLVFAFSLTADIYVQNNHADQQIVHQGDLLQLTHPNNVELASTDLILVFIKNINE
jgi:uncharacterized protein